MKRMLISLFVLGSVSAASAAQPYGTPLVAASTNGVWTTLHGMNPTTGAPLWSAAFSWFIPAIAVDNDNRHLLLAGQIPAKTSDGLLRWDPVTRGAPTTVWAGAPLQTPDRVEVDQDGDYLVSSGAANGSGPSWLHKVRSDGSSISTVRQFPAGSRITAHLVDRASGDWLFAVGSPSQLMVVDRVTGTTTTVLSLGQRSVVDMVQDPRTPTVYLGSGPGGLLTFNPIARQVSFFALGASPTAITADRAPAQDGGVVYSFSQHGYTRFSGSGTDLGFVLLNRRSHAATFDQGRNLASVLRQSPNDRDVRISFPSQAGKAFIFALGAAGFHPGLPLPDGRVIPLNPDGLVQASVAGQLAPILVGNIGVLDAAGRATVRFNANPLGNAVRHVRVWGAVVTLDPAAPFGIGAIGVPQLYRL